MIKKKLAIALSVALLVSSMGISQIKADENLNTNPIVSENVTEDIVVNSDEAVNTATPEEATEVVTSSSSAGPISAFRSATENAALLTTNNVTPAPAPGPAPAAPAPAATDEVNIIFSADGGERAVKFSSLDEPLNKTDDQNATSDTSDKGGGATKKYFLFWSNIPNYRGTKAQINAGAKAFYADEPLRNAFPDGLPTDGKLYAVYMDASAAMFFADKLSGKITINRDISSAETMYERFPTKDDEPTTYYIPNDLPDSNNIQLGSEFELNPFINGFVRYSPSHYFQPGTAQYYGKRGPTNDNGYVEDRTSTSDNVKDTQYTFIDLHVKIDPRIQISNNLNFKLRSYSFKPHMILTKDYQKIDSAAFNIVDGNPETPISFNPNGEHEFIVRTVMRGRGEIPAPSFEESNTEDMKLITSDENNFTVSKEEIEKIARGEATPLVIEGEIKGGAHLYSYSVGGFFTLGGPTRIPTQKAKAVLLNYKYNKVSFNKNSAALEGNDPQIAPQNLGSSYVIHGMGIGNDSLAGTAPTVNPPENGEDSKDATIGNDMMTAPAEIIKNGEKYIFTGWNTMPDGSGQSFTDLTPVNEDITVYAQWRKNILVVTFVPNYDNQPSSQVFVEPNSSISGDNLNGTDPVTNDSYNMPADPVRDGYIFKSWNTIENGTGTLFNGDTIVTENITVYGQWVRTTEWVDENNAPLKAMITDTDIHEHGEIAGHVFDRTENTPTGVKHIFNKSNTPAVEVTTEWVDEADNTPLKPSVTSTAAAEAGTIEGYKYIRTEATNIGVKHLFRKTESNVKLFTTEWVDENNVTLKPIVRAESTQPAGIILGFVYLRTENTDTGIKHVFTRAEDNSSGGSNSGSSSSGGGSSTRPGKSSSHNSGGPGVNPSVVVVNPTPETTVSAPTQPETPATIKPNASLDVKSVSPVPKTADNNTLALWGYAILASLGALATLIYNKKRKYI